MRFFEGTALYIAQERYEDAEPLPPDAHNSRAAKLGYEHPRPIDSLHELVRLYEPWNKPDEATKWRAKLPSKRAAQE